MEKDKEKGQQEQNTPARNPEETEDCNQSEHVIITNEERESIEKGIADADAGKLNPHSKAREIYSKWLHPE